MSLFSGSRNGLKILVVQHSDSAPCGNFCASLGRRGAQTVPVAPGKGEALPAGPDGFDGLVVLGGPQHAFEDGPTPHFQSLMELMRLFDARKKPVAGICLGCQLLARAHGGRGFTLDTIEFGFARHRLTREGEQDPVVGGIDLPPLMGFHEDSFELPKGAVLLVEGEQCANQCFKVGNCSYGFQFHLEVDGTLDEWIQKFRSGSIESYKKYMHLYKDEFFHSMNENRSILLSESEAYCDQVVERWMGLTGKVSNFRVIAK